MSGNREQKSPNNATQKMFPGKHQKRGKSGQRPEPVGSSVGDYKNPNVLTITKGQDPPMYRLECYTENAPNEFSGIPKVN